MSCYRFVMELCSFERNNNSLKSLFTFCFVCLLLPQLIHAGAYEDYIKKYSKLAVYEMHYSGIPASIIMAQALLESKYGQSGLATKANNHFGVKCKPEWKGQTINFTDDAPNECFRKYGSVEESFRDHSNFLKFHRLGFYDELFQYSCHDYHSWAKGLKQAGYATKPDYHKALIQIIESNSLDELDHWALDISVAEFEQWVLKVNQKLHGCFKPYLDKKNERWPMKPLRPFPLYAYTYEPPRTNGMTFKSTPKWKEIEANAKAGPSSISTTKKSQSISSLTKSKPTPSVLKIHVIKEGENMESVASKYDMPLEQLYQKNHLIFGSQPEYGEKIYLNQTAPARPLLRKL